MDVESLALTFTGSAIESEQSSLESPVIAGEPFHASPEELFREYESASLEAFLSSEANSSLGSYVLVDPRPDGRSRIVTSPGYCGGYLVDVGEETYLATTLSEARSGLADPVLETDVVRQAIHRNLTMRPLYSTILEDVRRLPSAWVVEISDGAVDRQFGYLNRAGSDDRPKSFAEAINTAMRQLANFARSNERTVTVFFSGGVDSLAIYLAAEKFLPDDLLRVVSYETGNITNGPALALPIANELGMDLEVVESDWDGWPPERDEGVRHLESVLSREYAKPASHVHYYTSDVGDEGDIVLLGQNMGLWIRGRQAGRRTPYHHGFSPGEALRSPTAHGPVIMRFLREFRFSNVYVSSSLIKSLYRALYDLKDSDRTIEFDHSLQGYLKGVLRTQRPNVISDSYMDGLDALYDADREVQLFTDRVSDAYAQRTIDMFSYYWYGNNAFKLMGTANLASGATAHFPAMWGPIASHYLGRTRTPLDSLGPKRAFYKYVKQECGRHYHDLTGFTPSQMDRRENRSVDDGNATHVPAYVRENRDAFDVDASAMVAMAESPEAEAEFRELFDRVEGMLEAAPDEGIENGSLVDSLLNTELILSR